MSEHTTASANERLGDLLRKAQDRIAEMERGLEELKAWRAEAIALYQPSAQKEETR